MHNTIEQLSYVVPAISIGFLLIITSINVYFKIRRKFPATVNCWFCNGNSRVPYAEANGWTCKRCDQYNGFTADGDYNCDIPAQRNAKLNKWRNVSATSSLNGSLNGSINGRMNAKNGLCSSCNRNQELKVQQLASFEPENEAYFDEEIEEYRQKLEQAYRLCGSCERHLKRALNRAKTNILGSKLTQIGVKGLQAFNLNDKTKTKKQIHQKRQIFARLALFALILISATQLYLASSQINITKAKLDSWFNSSTTTTILKMLSIFSAVKIIFIQAINQVFDLPYISVAIFSLKLFIKYLYTFVGGNVWHFIDTNELTKLIDAEEFSSLSSDNGFSTVTTMSGCFLSTFLLFLFGLEIGAVLSLLLWSFSMVLPILMTSYSEPLLVDVIGLSILWSQAIISFVNFFTLPRKSVQSNTENNSSFHRMDSESNSDVSDVSDSENELEVSLQSNASQRSKRSMWNSTQFLNKSMVSNTPSFYSTSNCTLPMRQRNYATSTQSLNMIHNNSFDSAFRQKSKRIHTADTRNDIFSLNKSSYASSSLSLRSNQNHRNQLSQSIISERIGAPSSSLANSMMNLNTSGPQINGKDLRCASRNSMYDIPDDFESGITHLSIGSKNVAYKNQTKLFGAVDSRLRNPILMPSRLSMTMQENHLPSHQSSWLAGGYWNNAGTSPQKKASMMSTNHYVRAEPAPSIVSRTGDVFPMMSRTSSQSSGFESMKNSSTNNNSRENSLCDDTEMDRTFCEPTQLSHSSKHLTSNKLIKPQPQKFTNFSFLRDNDCGRPRSTISINHDRPMFGNIETNNEFGCQAQTPTPSLVHSQRSAPIMLGGNNAFDTFQLNQQLPPASSAPFSNYTNAGSRTITPNDEFFSSSMSSFNEFNKDLSSYTSKDPSFRRPNQFQRGSLIKMDALADD